MRRPLVRLNVGCGDFANHALAVLLALATALLSQTATAQPTGPQTTPTGPASAPMSSPGTADASDCTRFDVLRTASSSGTGLEGNKYVAQNGELAFEGAVWNAADAVQLKDSNAQLVFDLGVVRSLQALVLQGDNNDSMTIEGSLDGQAYTLWWTAMPVETGPGLRTRFIVLPKPQTARFLRVRALGGDGFYSVSEVRAYCKTPTVWPPPLRFPPKVYGWAGITNELMVDIKGWLAAFGTLLLLSYVALRKRPHVLRRTRDVTLAMLGLVGFLSFWNFGHFHFDHYIHIWEHYHYYIGGKYGPELRYGRLYECTAAADLADGMREQVVKRKIRDLAVTNELGSSDAIVADPTRCTKHFTPQRWEAFRKDIRFFRSQFSHDRWDESQNDHGYNGTPVWGILGRAIAEAGDVSMLKINEIGWIDTGLLTLMWAVVWWAFGWRAMCVATLYWGFNFPARFWWNGGSFLRYDYLLWLVVGICMLKKNWHVAGGMALTYSTLLRIFPGFVVTALILKALARMIRLRRFVISKNHLRFGAGCVLALAILIPSSSWATGGLDAWGEFARNARKHLHTGLTNNMGLKTALAFDPETAAEYMRNSTTSDPFRDWKDAREYFAAKRQPILYTLLFLFCIILACAADREPDWSAACLGVGMIAMASELTCYYYTFFLAYGLLWERRKLPGIAATALAGLTCLVSDLIGWNDRHFAVMSVATALMIVLVTAHVGFGKRVAASNESD